MEDLQDICQLKLLIHQNPLINVTVRIQKWAEINLFTILKF